MLDVLHFLPISLRLLERLDDERSSRGHDRDLRLSILNSELHGDAESLPVLGGLFGDVLSDLFGGESEGADLGGEGGGGADLASGDADVDVDDLGGVELGRHGGDLGFSRVWGRGKT